MAMVLMQVGLDSLREINVVFQSLWFSISDAMQIQFSYIFVKMS